MIPIIYIITYIISFITILGWFLAYDLHEFPTDNIYKRKESIGMSILFAGMLSIFGPIGVVSTWLMTGFGCRGWTLKIK